jgi:hypothetical protein
MKMFKLLTTGCLAVMLSACGSTILDETLVNQKELAVLTHLNNIVYNSCNVYPVKVVKAINKRMSAPVVEVSFKDVEYLIKAFDDSLTCTKTKTTLQELYYKLYNEKLFSGKGVVLERGSTSQELLSAKEIRELTDTVKSCNVAKVKVISLLDQNNLLTIADKNSIEKLVLRCESDKLIQELNN